MFSNNDGTYTIYLYGYPYLEDNRDIKTVTSYTVDENGIGTEDNSGESVILSER